jgi:hypothetical protein
MNHPKILNVPSGDEGVQCVMKDESSLLPFSPDLRRNSKSSFSIFEFPDHFEFLLNHRMRCDIAACHFNVMNVIDRQIEVGGKESISNYEYIATSCQCMNYLCS